MKPDRTSEYSLQFLKILEESLKIQWNDGNLPIFNSDAINTFSISKMRSDLIDLMNSKLKLDALVDIENCPRPSIQTTGIGLAKDFDLFVKLGFLLGDRIILWDSIILGMLSDRDDLVKKIPLGEVACSFLLLKPAIELGGVAILPHPITWLERAKRYFQSFAGQNNISTDFLGYVNARALLDEKIPLHPYSMTYNHEIFKSIIQNDDRYQKDKFEYHKLLSNIFENNHFCYLKNISAANFYKVLYFLSNDKTSTDDSFSALDFRQELATSLQLPTIGLSNEEKNIYIKNIFKKLNRSINEKNSEIEKYSTSKNGTVVGAVGSTISLISSVVNGSILVDILVLSLNAASDNISLLEKVAGKPKEMTFYQVFKILDEIAEKEKLDEIRRNISNANIFGNEPLENDLSSGL